MINTMGKCILLVIGITIFAIQACKQPNNQPRNSTNVETDYERVMESKELKVGYIPYPPGFIKDPNSQELSGIFHDVLVEMGKNLGIKVDFATEVGWGTMIEDLNNNKIDLVCTAIWPNSQRGKFADFTVPLYYSPVLPYVQKGNKEFDNNLGKLNSNKYKIATIDGEMVATIAKSDFPNAETISLTQNSDVSQMLLEIASGKADITFVEPVIANEFISKNPNSIEQVKGVSPVRIFPNVMMFSINEPALKSMLNTSINELMNTGKVDNIINNYEPYPNSFFRVAKPYVQ